MHTELIPDNCGNWREVQIHDNCNVSLRNFNGIWLYVVEDSNGNVVNNVQSRCVASSDSVFEHYSKKD